MMRKNMAFILLGGAFVLVLVGSISGVWMYKSFFEKPQYVTLSEGPVAPTFSKYTESSEDSPHPGFVEAVRVTRPAVVHIKSRYALKKNNQNSDFFSNPFRDFFDDNNGGDSPQGMASGSGVLISKEGYIATNNHVIADADELEVTLFDKRTFKAEVIGVDPNTDLALIKIDAVDAPYVSFGNSDKVQVGEWVLAVGNPMDLTSTVTAGIVSAKGRNISLLEGDRGTDRGLTIESFIQTDAAVNKGNSGGALVNSFGELIGINTAIASRTGSYAGYSFAIPATLVKKVMEDLLAYGEVRRGFLGIRIQEISTQLAEEQGLKTLEGAYITSVNRNSGAGEAGIEAGDVITNVNGIVIHNPSELQEAVSRYRPGDKIKIQILRGTASKILDVNLRGQTGETTVAATKTETSMKGSYFRLLTAEERRELGVTYGIKVEDAGPKLTRGGVQDGFVITEVNGEKMRTIEQFERSVIDSGDFVTIKGLFSEGMNASYSFSW